jgi:hypothetical protein
VPSQSLRKWGAVGGECLRARLRVVMQRERVVREDPATGCNDAPELRDRLVQVGEVQRIYCDDCPVALRWQPTSSTLL